MKLISIKDSKTKGYLTLLITDGEEKTVLTVSKGDFCGEGSFSRGDNLTRDNLEAFVASDVRYKARKKALNILAYGDNSEKMLCIKLVRGGIPQDVAKETVKEMTSLGYINSKRQLERLITNFVNVSNIGPKKIIPKLIAKGYSKNEIEASLRELLQSGEIDFDRARESLIRKKLPIGATNEEKKQLLYKNGYNVC